MRDHEAEDQFQIPDPLLKSMAAFSGLPGGPRLLARLLVHTGRLKEEEPILEGYEPSGMPDEYEARRHDPTLGHDLATFVADNWDHRHKIFASLMKFASLVGQSMFITPLIAETYYRALVAHDSCNDFPQGHGGLKGLVARVTGEGAPFADFAGNLIQDIWQHRGDEAAADLKVRAIQQALLTEEWSLDEEALGAIQKEWPKLLAKQEADLAKIEAKIALVKDSTFSVTQEELDLINRVQNGGGA
jgi:hypothetical protein